MNQEIKTVKLGDGIFFTEIPSDKFKTEMISINLTVVTDKNSLSRDSVIPLVLEKHWSGCPDMTAQSKMLDSLYGAIICGGITRRGDRHTVKLSAAYLSDGFTLGNEKIQKKCADLVFSMLLSPVVENGGFERTVFGNCRQNYIDEIRSLVSDKDAYLAQMLRAEMLCSVPSGITDSVGNASRMTAVSAYKRYKELLRTAKIDIIKVGKPGGRELVCELKQRVSKLPRSYAPVAHDLVCMPHGKPKRKYKSFDVEQTKLGMGYLLCDYKASDADALFMTNVVLGATPFSRLFVNVREKRSLCYSIRSQCNKNHGALSVFAGIDYKNHAEAEKAINEQIEDLKREKLTPEELENARRFVRTVYSSAEDSNAMIMNFYASELCQDDRLLSPEERARLAFSVTAEEIQACAERLKLDTVCTIKPRKAAEK